MHNQRPNQPGVAEPQFGLGRMHVDVDLTRRKRDEQRQHGMPVARQIVGIGRTYRAEQKLVPHRTAVDEQILAERVRPRQCGQRRIAVDDDTLALRGDLDRIGAKLRPEHIAEPRQPTGSAR